MKPQRCNVQSNLQKMDVLLVSDFLQSKRSETVVRLPDVVSYSIDSTFLNYFTTVVLALCEFFGSPNPNTLQRSSMLWIGTVEFATGDGTVGYSRSGPKDDVRTAGSGAGCEDLQGAVLEADWR